MDLYNQSLDIARWFGDRQVIAGNLNNIASIHDKKGEYVTY
jgi:hypothetical protein